MKAVIFDCFGVLYVDSSRHFYETHVPDYEQLSPQLLELNRAYDYGLIERAELTHSVADLTGLSLLFVEQHIHSVQIRNQELMKYAAELRQRYKVGLLSNIGIGGMESYFPESERRELFDATVLSGEVGTTKPHRQIYEIMAERLGVAPKECVMIDDLDDNCAGANAAGMKAILYRSNAQLRRELEKLLAENSNQS